MDNSQALAAFHEICSYAAPLDVDVLIEPVEKPYANWIQTAADGAALKQILAEENFNMMLDYSAMCSAESSTEEAIRQFAGKIVLHIHLSEQDRYYPGHYGTEHFRTFISQCAKAGYAAPFVVEAYPIPDQRTAAVKSFEALAPILKDVYGWERSH